MDEKLLRVSVVGLGKLGYPLAACFAAKGYGVVGVDLDSRTVDIVNLGRSPVRETGVHNLLQNAEGRLKAILNVGEAVLDSDVTLIVVPTPSGPDGTLSNHHVLNACEAIAGGLAEKRTHHVVVLVSTVMPGSTGGEIRLKLEQVSGKNCGTDFGLCYVPAFVALGSVVRNFLCPDYLLIGESDTRSGDLLEGLYKNVCDNDPPVARMNFINAELTKLATNSFVSTKITFGNMIAQVCEQLLDAHVDVVTSALGLDSRIGGKYLKGSIGYGGPCLVRDNIALAALAQNIGGRAWLAEATDQANRQEVDRLVALIKTKRDGGGVVGILGLAYKPETNVVDASQGLLLAQVLAAEGIPVNAYDPAAMDQARQVLGASVGLSDSAENCIQQSDLVVITTPWKGFEAIEPKVFGTPGSRVLIDCWRILESSQIAAVTDYIPLGVGPVSNGPAT
jgi:UDPglucose 6-dehydrogenase